MNRIISFRSLLVFFFVLSGCGYHWADDTNQTISVPYVLNDPDGTLTAEIIRQISSNTSYRVASNGRYRLEASIAQESIEPLGYRRDPQKIKGKIHKHLTQNEERKVLLVEITLFENTHPIIGPLKLSSDVDYDYIDGDCLQDLQFQNASGEKRTVLPFSLGQLEPEEAATEAAQRPLYRKISQKIVDIITTECR